MLCARDLKAAVDAEREKARLLSEANARLHILDRLKMDFLSFVAHELRTPLSMMSSIDILNPDDDPQAQALLLDSLRQGYGRLETFVQKGLTYFDWLGVNHIETTEVTDLSEAVAAVTGQMPKLVDAAVSFEFHAPTEPGHVIGQEQDLITVIHTLLDNALKFSPDQKSIRADMQVAEGQFSFSVSDRGNGFAQELANELFHPFTCADIAHQEHGTGLSLATARAIIEAHGGTLQASSTGPGHGAKFTVTLPAACPPHAALPLHEAKASSQLKE